MILITGFEPFGGNPFNPSQALIESFTAQMNFNFRLLILPVDWDRALEKLIPVLKSEKFRAIFHFGLAQDRNEISLEKYAHNLCRSGLKDNRGNSFLRDTSIAPKGPAILESGINLMALRDFLNNSGFYTNVSEDAGRYLCNYIYYNSLLQSHHTENPGKSEVCFIHLPLISDKKQIDHLAQVFGDYLKRTCI
jgi:pyroglutamyl-peptidase